MNHRNAVISAALALLAAPALGQVVPPPPAEAPAPEKQVPVNPGIPQMPPPNITPVVVPTRKTATPIKLPNLPYKPLVEKSADGKVKRLSEPAEYAALKHNPMLKPEEVAGMSGYMGERKAAFEPIVIANLDLVEQIEGGIFENIDVKNNDAFKNLLNVGKPLKAPAAPKPVYEDLRDKNVLTPEQAEFNRKISSEYYQALIAELNADHRRNLAMSYKQYLDEPLYYHRLLLIEAAPQAESLLGKLGLEPALASKVRPLAQKAKAAKTDDDKAAAMRALSTELSLDQRKALLRAVTEARPAAK
jgi:hypothetical protein